jgi:8-oxo-dGTP pyrophosphatase MutT (NUDIX family)
MVQTVDNLPIWLADQLRSHRPDRWARERFAPAQSYGRHFGPGLATTRSAAVMILLMRDRAGWHFPLTRRPATLRHHAGQISLPGGAAEPGEVAEQTALRELQEELGVSARGIQMLGRLSESYLFVSDFSVTPCVAWVPHRLHSFRPQAFEVEEVIPFPLEELLRSSNRATVLIRDGLVVAEDAVQAPHAETGSHVLRAPAICWKNHVIWGATAIVLGELIAILERFEDLAGSGNTNFVPRTGVH